MPETIAPNASASVVPDLAEYNRSLIEACPDPIIAIGAEGQITDTNRAFLTMTGVSREKLIGSDFAGYFTDPELARACHREAFSRGSTTGYPLAIRHTSGRVTDLLCNAASYGKAPIGGARVVVIAHDVSQQKRREKELAQLHADMMVHSEELKQRESEIKRINDLYEVLQACNSQQEAYPVIGSVGTELFPKASGALAVSVSRAHQLETVVEWGTAPRMAARFQLDDCWAVRRGQMQEVAKPGALQACRHFESAPPGPYICLPLSVRGELLGLLNLRCAPGDPPQPQQLHLLTVLGEVIKLSSPA